MSRSAFALRFKELLGQAPLEYVTEWRMQKAVRLLQQPEKKLFEIARSVGYESDAAFSKAFKRVLGVTPGEHRQNDTQRTQPAGASFCCTLAMMPFSRLWFFSPTEYFLNA
jgi:AraC-like DNA-binding protein